MGVHINSWGDLQSGQCSKHFLSLYSALGTTCPICVCVCRCVFKRWRETERERDREEDREREEVPFLKEPTSVGSKRVRRSTLCGDAFKEEGTGSAEASRGGPRTSCCSCSDAKLYLTWRSRGL